MDSEMNCNYNQEIDSGKKVACNHFDDEGIVVVATGL